MNGYNDNVVNEASRDIIDLLKTAELHAIAKAEGSDFWIHDTQLFFQEFRENVLGKFNNEQSVQDIYDLTQDDYSAIFLMIKKYSKLKYAADDNLDFVMRFCYALESIKEIFSNEIAKVKDEK